MEYVYPNELQHHGILGQKWGVRRYQNKDGTLTEKGKKRNKNYHSIGIRAIVARKQNEKIDRSFQKWNENAEKKKKAIELGKKMNVSKMAYENDKNDKELKKQYKSDKKMYDKAFKANTTYRKGQIKSEIASDISRKYLSAAKKINKEMALNPNDKNLKKKYNEYMSKHDIERQKARVAPEAAANRSNKIASLKRARTIAIKSIVGTAAIGAATAATNHYLKSHNVTLDGNPVRIDKVTLSNIHEKTKNAFKLFKYVG